MPRCLVLVALALLVGCAPPPPVAARAEGVVTLDGEPVHSGKLDLVSAEGSVSAAIGPDGHFQVPSLPPGRYKVAVGPVPPRQGPGKAAGVLRQGDNDHKDDIRPDPKAPKGPSVPKKYNKPESSGIEVEIGPGLPPLAIKLTSK